MIEKIRARASRIATQQRYLRMPAKLGILTALLLLPMAAMLVQTISRQQTRVDQAQAELGALRVNDALANVMQVLLQSGDAGADRGAMLKAAIADVGQAVEANDNAAVSELWRVHREPLARLVADPSSSGRDAELLMAHGLRETMLEVAEASDLTHEPDPLLNTRVDLLYDRVLPMMLAVADAWADGAVAKGAGGDPRATAAAAWHARYLRQSLTLLQGRVEAMAQHGAVATSQWVLVQRNLADLAQALDDAAIPGTQATSVDTFDRIATEALGALHGAWKIESTSLAEGLDAQIVGERRAQAGTVLAAAALLAAFLWFSRVIVAGLHSSMRVLGRHVEALGQGDLARDMSLEGTDEVAELAGTVDAMGRRISRLVGDMRSSAARMNEASHQAADDAMLLAQSTDGQATTLKESVAALDELNRRAAATSRIAASTSAMGNEMRERVEHGGQVIEDTVQAVDRLQVTAQRVGEINNLIDDIAFQTNIVALNASVEAAHAGEAGQGFSVVAAEIRQLARRCADAAGEIRLLIEQTTEQVDGAASRIREVQDSLGSMSGHVGTVAQQLNQISSDVDAQCAGLQEVADRANSLRELTAENALALHRAESASRSLLQQSQAFENIVGVMRLRQGTADEARQLAQRAMARVSEVGWERAAAEFNAAGGRFCDRDLYIFALDADDRYLAMGRSPQHVGRSIREVDGITDQMAGRFLDLAREAAAFGGGWIEYDALDVTGRVPVRKSAWIEPLGDDGFLGCGHQTGDASPAASVAPATDDEDADAAAGTGGAARAVDAVPEDEFLVL